MLSGNQIRAKLLERDISLVDIASKLHVSPITVSVVITRRGSSRRIQTYIADILGLDFKDVWNNHHRKAA